MTNAPTARIDATVRGLVAGDAIAWPSWWHRLGQLPPRRAFRLREAAAHTRDRHATSVPTPYLQSSSPSIIDPAGATDDVEWFVVGVRHLLGQRLDGTSAEEPFAVWYELARSRAAEPRSVRGRLAVTEALANLTRGLEPPASGNDNVHYFDDLAMVRAIAAGLLRPGQPERAAELAGRDASVTHAQDGIHGSRAFAAVIAAAQTGASVDELITSARAQLPPDSWIGSVVDECLVAASSEAASGGPLALAAHLEREVVDHVYAFSNQAPESLGLLLAHLRGARDARDLQLGALAHPRHADGLVPLAGALAGAVFGVDDRGELPTLQGVCVEALSGLKLGTVVAELAAAAHPAADEGTVSTS